jgi:hypothetical protein
LGTIDKATSGTVGMFCAARARIVVIDLDLSVEILGQVVDSNSSDEYLSQLRLEKIGISLVSRLLFIYVLFILSFSYFSFLLLLNYDSSDC